MFIMLKPLKVVGHIGITPLLFIEEGSLPSEEKKAGAEIAQADLPSYFLLLPSLFPLLLLRR